MKITKILVCLALLLTLAGCGAAKNEKEFTFKVKFEDSTSKTYKIKTDDKTVGEALQDKKLIEGTKSSYGLFVTEVAKQKAENNDYWAFYIDGKMAPTGVDATKVVAHKTYSFVYTKAD
ncbi:MAG: DUF4430 domain-containing protein [Lactobacillales bacterium]|jgi:hypothetical protein|nr:DUF4430 domain-containing protein [Lactobacillales bacterium]